MNRYGKSSSMLTSTWTPMRFTSRLARGLPASNLSTVYHNLQVFKELGLAEEHEFGSRRYYKPAPQAKHHHLICLSCGRVFEFKCPSTEWLKSTISKEEGFRVTDAEVRIAGYCSECQERLTVSAAENRTISGQ